MHLRRLRACSHTVASACGHLRARAGIPCRSGWPWCNACPGNTGEQRGGSAVQCFTVNDLHRPDGCMGGIVKSDVLENSFHTEQDSSLLVLLSPGLPHTWAVSPWIPVIHGAASSVSPMPQLLSEDCSPTGVAEPCEPQPHWCPASGATWAFSGLGNSVDLHGAGLTSAGLGTCTVPASVHGHGRFPHLLRVQVHWRLNT